MFTIKSVEITGLWGDRLARISFHDDVNFLIGPNGSGKTTIIGILAAILDADRLSIQRLPFDKATILLADPLTQSEASVQVEKQAAETGPVVRYQIAEPDKEVQRHVLVVRSDTPSVEGTSIGGPMSATRALRRRQTARQNLRRLVNMRWLSVHRAPVHGRVGQEKSYDSTVDIRLDQVRLDFVKYFSKLSNQSASFFRQFIDTVFLSVIDQPSFDKVSGALEQLVTAEEQQTLGAMFETLWMEPEQYKPRVENLMEMLHQAIERQQRGQQLSNDQIGAIFAMSRLSALEFEWRTMKKEQEQATKPIDDFRAVLNRLFRRKSVDLNDNNELVATLQSGEILDLKDLSSGEKQLIILFGEALLQEGAASVYLADEPELSLHVAWQEQLVSSLRELNASAQLIFATHSPDIVSVYGDRVIDMERVLQ
jgi:ABC-type cobalamin/Fe3+-siderophores transport system ATPase subunit